MNTSVIGYPRIGRNRELKFASEKYFKGEIGEAALKITASSIRKENWLVQKEAGITYISSNDFSFYDNVLDTAVLFNIIPGRYKALNLHSFFEDGHFEVRCANGSLHAGVLRAELCLILAISNAAMTKKYCSPAVSYSDNMRYSFRVWLLNLGMIGDEFKNCRMHLLKHLDGNIAWRHPEDALAQRERLRAERETARNVRVRPVSSETDEVGVTTPTEEESPAVSDFDGVSDEDFFAEETEGLLYPI